MSRAHHKFKGLFAMLFILLMVIVSLTASAFAAELPTTTAIITVEKMLTGDTPPNAETFVFTLTPDDASFPMPEGTNRDTLITQGTGTASFGAITYTEPNTYTYTVRETPGNSLNYTYDKTIYKVTVYVTTDDAGNLAANVWAIKDESSGKSANTVFTNSYKSPEATDHPKTGDISNVALWIVLAVISFAMLLVIMGLTWRKYKGRCDDKNETNKV